MDLNLDRMVRSATEFWAGEPYCELIVDCLWQTPGVIGMSVEDIGAFWEGAARSELTVQGSLTPSGWSCRSFLRPVAHPTRNPAWAPVQQGIGVRT